MRNAGRKAKLPVITEIMSADKLRYSLEDGVDIIQIGPAICRTSTSFGKSARRRKPVLLKRLARPSKMAHVRGISCENAEQRHPL